MSLSNIDIVFKLDYIDDKGCSNTVYLLQQRSPCVEGKMVEFCNSLSSWLKSEQIQCKMLMIPTGASLIDLPDEAFTKYFE